MKNCMPVMIKWIGCLLTVSMLMTSLAYSGPPGVSGGGLIDPKSTELLDFAEVESGGLVPFLPQKLPIYYSLVEPVLRRISTTKYKAMNIFMSEALLGQKKPWFFTNGKLDKFLNTKNIHVLTDSKTKEVVAVQNSTSIRVYKPWFDRKMNGNDKEKLSAAGLIVHEAVMYIALIAGAPHDDVREVVRALFAPELILQPFAAVSFPAIVDMNNMATPIKQIMIGHAQELIGLIDEAYNIYFPNNSPSSNIYSQWRDLVSRVNRIVRCGSDQENLFCDYNDDIGLFAYILADTILPKNTNQKEIVKLHLENVKGSVQKYISDLQGTIVFYPGQTSR